MDTHNKNILVGFIGYGNVLQEACKICNRLGYHYVHYADVPTLTTCDALFAYRFRKIIPAETIEAVPGGIIVTHSGLLPNYRGFYPINNAIRNGETEIGITMFYIDEGIDTGDIIDQRTIHITDNETVSAIYRRCDDIFIDMFQSNIQNIIEQTAKHTKQPEAGSTFNSKLSKKIERIDASVDLKKVHNFIRSLTGEGQKRAYIENDKYRLYFNETTLEIKEDNYGSDDT